MSAPLAITAVVSALAVLAVHAENRALSANIGLLEWLGTTTLLGLAFMAGALARRWRAWVDWVVFTCLAAMLALWVLEETRWGGHAGARVVLWGHGYAPAVWPVLPVLACILLIVNARRLELLPHPFVVRV